MSVNSGESLTGIALAGIGAGIAGVSAGFAFGWVLGRRQLNADKASPPSSWSEATLTRSGLRKGYDAGMPYTAVQPFSSAIKGNLNGAGLWSCERGGFPVKNRTTTETVLILEGTATITDDKDGKKHHLKPGTWHTLPSGWSGRWDVTEKLRKLYILTP